MEKTEVKLAYEFGVLTWLKIATIVDNEFIGSADTFRFIRKKGYYYLTSNRCDNSSIIRCYIDHEHLTKITRCGPDTESWQEVYPVTYNRINEHLEAIGANLIDPLLNY